MKATPAPAKKAAPRARTAAKSATVDSATSNDSPVKRTAPAKRARKTTPAKAVVAPTAPADQPKTEMPAQTAPTETTTAGPTTDAPQVTTVESPPVSATETLPVSAAQTPAVSAAQTPPVSTAQTPAVSKESLHPIPTQPTRATHPVTPTPDQLAVDLWPRLLADPRNAARLLAETAVQTLGPRAGAWAAHTRSAYPTATPQALARLATARFTRTATLRGGLSALSGAYAPVALVATASLTHAELVLHLAAAYGLDPTHPDRAAEILVLLPGYRGGAVWAGLRLADRVLPGTSLLGAALGGHNAAEAVATRAERRYGGYAGQTAQPAGQAARTVGQAPETAGQPAQTAEQADQADRAEQAGPAEQAGRRPAGRS
ncbi:hypothetical protein BJY16_001448 [Actinoplanes octamycinicus]|uniref:Uncharacterized protein n=1 Tax=Actinoplanes octamycinicus TaxID=135948 RepID=A0A7W7M5Q5_9ACTN|nr:hypothetical protein [Actinoplanes octamycinicus]MBB4737989.1 hypothetical protein [Actinoplanes octamycinicus]